MNENEVKWLMNRLLQEAGETATVLSVEPYRSFVIRQDENGKRYAQYIPGYRGLSVHLDYPLTNPTRVYHVLDQNINAGVRIRHKCIYLDDTRETLPFTAPEPRYR